MTVTLLEDIKSLIRSKKKVKVFYGMKGEVVKVIAISGDVYIVEGKERFPVHKNKVKI